MGLYRRVVAVSSRDGSTDVYGGGNGTDQSSVEVTVKGQFTCVIPIRYPGFGCTYNNEVWGIKCSDPVEQEESGSE